jgi:hypothetical protein
MMRARRILIAGAHLSVVGAALAQGATAIQGDGTVVEVKESTLTGLDDGTWPGWPGLWIGPSVPQAPDGGSAMILQDGQVLIGGFEPNGRELWWRNPKIGAVKVDLERVARIGPLAADPTRPVTRDELHFVNGDRAAGFIQSIDVAHGVRLAPITPEGTPSTEVVDHDLERVVAVWLASRREPAKGWRFWLRDGSVIDADHWRREREQIILEGCHLAGAPPRLPLDWAQVIAVRSAPTAVLALASQRWRSDDVADTPRLAPARGHLGAGSYALDLSPIDLHGPGIFEATIPQGAWILDASLGVPPGLQGKVACQVVILDGDREIARFPIAESSTVTPLHIMIQSGRLVVRIEHSRHGAFGAAIRMIRPFLVPVTAAAAAPSPSTSSGTAPQAGP